MRKPDVAFVEAALVVPGASPKAVAAPETVEVIVERSAMRVRPKP